MPTWLAILTILVVVVALFEDFRRAAARDRLSGLPRRHYPILVSEDDRLYPITEEQLQQYVRDVRLHRRLGYEGVCRDLGVGETTGDVAEHLELARGQLIKPGSRLLN
jgi:hypothetical protein